MSWSIRGNFVHATANPFAPESNNNDDNNDDTNSKEVLLWLGPGLCILLDHILTVHTETGKILSLEPYNSIHTNTVTTTIHLKEHEFLCPGMIDTHIHAPQFAYTGTATDRPLTGPNGWLETYAFPAERRLRTDIQQAQRVYEAVVDTTLRHGTTSAVYFATLDVAPCQVLVDVAFQKGQRALIGKVCMDRNAPSDYCQSTEQNLQETRQLIHYIYQKAGRRCRRIGSSNTDEDDSSSFLPRILPLITPRFIPTCTPELLTALGKLAAEENCHITSHISESLDEVAWSRQLDVLQHKQQQEQHQSSSAADASKNNTTTTSNSAAQPVKGRTDAAIFDAHGLLTDQCVMAHGVWLNDNDDNDDDNDDTFLLRNRGTAIAHCPLSNFFFADGGLPCRKLLQAGNRVGLGTDVAGGYHPSMLDSCRMAVVASRALVHQQVQQVQLEDDTDDKDSSGQQQTSKVHSDAVILDYRHAFYLATLGGAEALNLQNHLGNFVVGKQFDAIVLTAEKNIFCNDTDRLEDIFQKICNLGDDRNIARVFVAGRQVV